MKEVIDMKRVLAYLLALLMLCVSIPAAVFAENLSADHQLTIQNLKDLNGGSVQIELKKGHITFVGGTCTKDKVTSTEDAQKVLNSMRTLMGGDTHFHFEPWKELHDSFGNHYYVFQQTHADQIVLGGAVKVITNAEGNMIGLTSTVVSDLPSEAEAEGVTAQQAEAAVLEHEAKSAQGAPAVIEGMTSRVVLPVQRELDLNADELYTHFVWVVYTINPTASFTESTDLPYLAHYVSMAGEYLYSLPTILPGDMAGSTGYDASYAFQFMEPVKYTGYVDWTDGTEHEITVDLMRDTRTGMYYLGNIERRIVVADCWQFLYNGGKVVMEYSPDNREWDQTSLQSLYNYCRAYDYYKELGWIGGDGEGTPIIVLKDFCDANHNPVNNAAYAGKFYGWQVFLSSSINDFSQCLDVIAHEFTHCVTGSVMTHNAYMNDYGAINEAMSDIQGNICQKMMEKSEDETWEIGEHSETTIRSMSNPNKYGQPSYSWDLHYQPNVKTPTAVNDRGGVHTNSSLLNHIAFLVSKEGGMTPEEARAFWFAVDCSMVPGTDYAQLRKLLPWVLHASGMDQYAESLSLAIEATRLGNAKVPSRPGDNQAMVMLNLPDNEVFNNGNWTINLMSMNLDNILSIASQYADCFRNGEYDKLPEPIQKLVENHLKKEQERKEKGFLEVLADAFTGKENAEEKAEGEAIAEGLRTWLQTMISENFFNGMASAGQDGHSIRLMSRPGYTVPMLMYMTFKPDSQEPDKLKMAFFVGGRWVDLSAFEAPEDSEIRKHTEEFVTNTMIGIFDQVIAGKDWREILDQLVLKVPADEEFTIPTDGLEDFSLEYTMASTETEQPVVRNTKSRPKLPEEETVPETNE